MCLSFHTAKRVHFCRNRPKALGERRRIDQGFGFTLIELLVVIAIVAVLAAILIPVVGEARRKALTVKSVSNVRELSNAALLHASTDNGRLPTTTGSEGSETQWQEVLYPLIYDGQEWPGFEPHATGENLKNTVFYCPLLDGAGEGEPMRSYGWNIFLKDGEGMAPPLCLINVRTPGKTVMLASAKNSSGLSPMGPQGGNASSRYGGQTIVAFIDGHVELTPTDEIPTSPQDEFWRSW
jgi:prepilin-type N-terminal cleavage/methylation domain-containing protein/prepilin-type processing-associated H-X9-DG protein